MKATKVLPVVLDYASPQVYRPVILNDGYVTTGMSLAWLAIGVVVVGMMFFSR